MPGIPACLRLAGGALRGLGDDAVAVGVREELVDIEPGDLAGELADQVVRDPAGVLAALVAVQRLLQVPEPDPARPPRGGTETP